MTFKFPPKQSAKVVDKKAPSNVKASLGRLAGKRKDFRGQKNGKKV